MPLALLFAALLAPVPAGGPADNWPQWRGPANDGISPSTASIPAEWGVDKNIIWKAKLPGPGSGTPCVWGDRMFFTAQTDAGLVLLCYGTDGAKKWSHAMGTGSGDFRGGEGNMASASCSTDGKLVFAFVGSGRLGAYDFDGKPAWEIDCQKKYGDFKIQFGAHWTPVLYKGTLYVQLLHRGAQRLLAFEAATGKELWNVARASDSPPGVESPDVYTSPVIWAKGGEALLISHGNDYCTAHKLTDGSEVWRVTELNPKAGYNRHWRAVASPLVLPDLVVVPSCKNGVVVAIDPAAANGNVAPASAAEVWRLPKGTPDVPSPLAVGSVLYLMRENGELTAHDLKTGKQFYSERVTSELHRANPAFADGKVILVGRGGTMPVVKPGPEFALLAKNKLPDTFTASPAIGNGRLYLRGWDSLWCVGTK